MALVPDDQRSQQRFLGILVLVAAAAAFYMYVYSPRSTELTEMEDRIAQVEDQNDVAEARTKNLDQARAELQRTERLFRALQELVPDRAEATQIYESLATRTEEMGLEMVNVVPAAPEPTPDGYYLRQRWNMTVEGDFHTIGRFLTRIASFERLVRPRVSSLDPIGSGDGDAVTQVRAVLSLDTYVLAPDTAQTGEQQGGGSGEST